MIGFFKEQYCSA